MDIRVNLQQALRGFTTKDETPTMSPVEKQMLEARIDFLEGALELCVSGARHAQTQLEAKVRTLSSLLDEMSKKHEQLREEHAQAIDDAAELEERLSEARRPRDAVRTAGTGGRGRKKASKRAKKGDAPETSESA
jgi:outer membrane murein-binding lipoprotein Lpp